MTITATWDPAEHPRAQTGAFTDKPQSAPETALGAPTVTGSFIDSWIRTSNTHGTVTDEVAAEAAATLNTGRNFSDERIAEVLDQISVRDRGCTHADEVKFHDAVELLRRSGHESAADDVYSYVSLVQAHRGGTPVVSDDEPVFAIVATEADDARVQAGEVLDNVVAFGTFFHRRREGVYADEPSAIRLQASSPLSDDEMQRLAQLAGYAYAAGVRGEPIGEPERDSRFSFVVGADTTKSRSDDISVAMQRFEDSLPELIEHGSPVRMTNRSGPGTAGTRLIDGLGPGLTVEIYYDYVV